MLLEWSDARRGAKNIYLIKRQVATNSHAARDHVRGEQTVLPELFRQLRSVLDRLPAGPYGHGNPFGIVGASTPERGYLCFKGLRRSAFGPGLIIQMGPTA